jgi:hypothetical protein
MRDWSDSPDVVAGIFDDAHQARTAVAQLREIGFDEQHLGILSPIRELPLRNRSVDVTEGALAGAGLGAAAGAWGVAILSAALPAIGPVVAGGVLTSVLSGVVGGGLAGALVGALTGLGLQGGAARHYANEIKQGKTLVLVRTDGRYSEAANILIHNGADTQSQGLEDTGAVPPEHVRGPSP